MDFLVKNSFGLSHEADPGVLVNGGCPPALGILGVHDEAVGEVEAREHGHEGQLGRCRRP